MPIESAAPGTAGAAGGPRGHAVAERIGGGLAFLSGLFILALMFLTCVDVALRAFVGSGILGVIELSQVALVATVYMAMMSSEIAGVHVRTPILTERLSPRWSHAVRLCGSVVSIAIVAWVTYSTWGVAVHATRAGEYLFGLARIPIWPAKLAVAFGMTAFLLALLSKFRNDLHGGPSRRLSEGAA